MSASQAKNPVRSSSASLHSKTQVISPSITARISHAAVGYVVPEGIVMGTMPLGIRDRFKVSIHRARSLC
ncbi:MULTISPECIES: hypothetical protein [Leptolyngbya]|uniref:hypothetical protein n=1 Tax=Leptolyngbya TaxID=47251 RepID=UPI0011818074|nr:MULTISPECIES: hypothetical protein [Leptolyngbya]MBD2377356.1 hypothetical protein [Leptolyngbya sp. FACHB-238]MBD2369537.1 hypothetical protein [Leptolyngbya sp. FACHB-161]MBD2401765.1 hypothetical protein [Leptolyngbya sp. FACHB-239]MBD2408232.1 hypothetical protein [Leptolyngbya sp. FACHB-402]ULP27773.1 hypothetical protein MCP04_17225 [Leptolyngbya boryana IU 594]